jgi:hypothetical protein
MLTVTNQFGVDFNIVKSGMSVKIYDARYTEKFGELGQHVAGYYAETLMGHKGMLSMWLEVHDWVLSGDNITDIQDWIEDTFDKKLYVKYFIKGDETGQLQTNRFFTSERLETFLENYGDAIEIFDMECGE